MQPKHTEVYRFHQDHPEGKRYYYATQKTKDKWVLDGVAFLTPPRPNGPGPVWPVFRYQLDTKKGGVRYAYSIETRQNYGEYEMDTVDFYAFHESAPGAVPIYVHARDHKEAPQYMLSQNKEVPSWKLQSVAFYAYPGPVK